MAILISTCSAGGCSKGKENIQVPQPSPEVTYAEKTGTSEIESLESKEDKKKLGLLLKDSIKNEVDVPFKPLRFEKKVKPYKVNSELSNIENLSQFGSFSNEQKERIYKNAFVVSPSKDEQLFYIYEKNSYLKIPNFITSDSILQVYHVFYDYSLRHLESDSLLGVVEELTGSMLKKSVNLYNSVKNPVVKNACMKNAAYFTVAQMALKRDLPSDLPKDIKDMADKEYNLLEKSEGFQRSCIFPYMIDYSQFRPRGHYTRTDDYKRYFKAMMWYGQAPFPLYKDKEETQRNEEQTLQALILTYCTFLEKEGTPDAELWEKIYEPTAFYVGKSDDLTLYNYKDLILKVYGENPEIEKIDDKDKLDELYKEAKKLPEPRIKGKYTEVDVPVGKQFRFMGQRYIPDSEIIQELVEPLKRPFPSGLDVMGVLGSDRAYDIQLGKPENSWEGYPKAFEKVRKDFSKVSEDTLRSNMYYGWLWTLRTLTKPFEEGYPSFMTNGAWEDKSLSTALGSWSELRHDTILYGKQTGAEAGGAEMPRVLGYVEPSVELYERLLWLTMYSRENLDGKKILSEEIKNAMQNFEDLLEFLIKCSVKELRNEELSEDEYMRIFTYGGLIEYLTSSLASDGARWHEIVSEADKNMAVIADFHTVAPNSMSQGGYMEAGVGSAHEIYVVVPIGGKLYLTRGAVFSYYEFLNDSGKRLTDEEWQNMIKENKCPKQPSWTKSFISEGKGKIPVPKEPYNDICGSREP